MRKTGSPEERLSTSDLAEAGDRTSHTINLGPVPEDQPLTSQAERRGMKPGNVSTSGAAAAPARQKEKDEEQAPLFTVDEAKDFRARWDSVQAGFVDEPRRAVESADQLVAATMKRLAEIFSAERQALEHQWDRGDSISTEELRLALRRYRSFFGRLLSV